MLLLIFIIIKKVTNMQKASLIVSYDNERHSELPPVGECIPSSSSPCGSTTAQFNCCCCCCYIITQWHNWHYGRGNRQVTLPSQRDSASGIDVT